jgi:beta-lactamase regulating signal transducer with metallopeptidase domain
MSGALFEGPVAQAIGWSLLHLVWEATIVAGILAAVLALMSRRSANARYVVSCAALALLPLLAFVTAYRAYDAPSPVAGSPAVAAQDASPIVPAATTPAAAITSFLVPADDSSPHMIGTLAARARGWLPQIVLLWLAGVTFFSIRLLVSWTRVQRLARASAQPAAASWQRAASRLASALRLRRAISLVESAAVEVPTVIGWLRPMILLPASTLTGLTAEQIEMVLAHELAHIRRHDFFVNLMQTVVETLMFYHPAAWWMSRRIRVERENCCDDLAIAVCGNPLQYARALTRLEELRAAQTELAVAANGGSLLSRIRRLVVPRESTGGAARWAAGAAVLAVVVVLFTLPSLPALADHEDSSKTKVKSDASKPAKSEIDVRPTEQSEESSDDVNVDVDVESDSESDNTPGVPAAPAAPPATPAPAAEPAPLADPPDPPDAPDAPDVPTVTVVTPRIAPVARAMGAIRPVITIAPQAINEAVAEAMSERPVRVRSMRDHEFSTTGKLTVDELIALRTAGVTPEYINDMRANAGFAELSLRDIFEMRQQGVTPKYIKDLRAAGISVKTPREAVEMRMQGVTADYVAQMSAAGYKNLTSRDLMSLRMQGVTPDYIAQLSAAGYRNLSVHDIISLRMHGVSPTFIKALSDAGYSNLTAEDLARLAMSGVNADFIREMSQYKKK